MHASTIASAERHNAWPANRTESRTSIHTISFNLDPKTCIAAAAVVSAMISAAEYITHTYICGVNGKINNVDSFCQRKGTERLVFLPEKGRNGKSATAQLIMQRKMENERR